MSKVHPDDPDILMEYDFSNGIRGKYAGLRQTGRLPDGSRVVLLDPDVAEMFTDSESVNRTLRALGQIIEDQTRQQQKPRSRRKATAAPRS